MRYLVLILSLVVSINSYSQNEYRLKKLNKNTVISIKIENSQTIDTISVPNGISKKHSYVKIIDKNVVMSSFYYIPPIANFNSSFIVLDKWIMKDGIFKTINSVKVIRNGCELNKTCFKLVENGIEWKVRNGLFRKSLKGFISFDDYSDKEYIIKCGNVSD